MSALPIVLACNAVPMVAAALVAVVRPGKAVTTLANVRRVVRPIVWERVVVQTVAQAVAVTAWWDKAVT